MTVSDINPFIRFAKRILVISQTTYTVSEDSRIFFVENIEGEGHIKILHNSLLLKNNSLIYIPAHIPYKFVMNYSAQILSVNFDFTGYRNKLTDPFKNNSISRLSEYITKKPDEIFTDYTPFNDYIYFKDGGFLFDDLNKIPYEFSGINPYSKETAYTMLKLLLLKMIKANEKSDLFYDTNYIKNRVPIKKAKEFIHNHYDENLTNDIIARQVDYHPYHLNRIFKKFEGVSIHKYLINYRISMAERLLLETDKSVTFIGSQVGFDNTTSFTENFKAKNHLSPLKYRNFHRKTF